MFSTRVAVVNAEAHSLVSPDAKEASCVTVGRQREGVEDLPFNHSINPASQ